MKTTLLYIGVGVAGFDAHRQPGDREGGWISHGLASIHASALVHGFDVNLIDLRQLAGWDDFRALIQEIPSDVYGLSVSPVDYAPALQAIIIIKQTLPNAKIVVGGIHPSLFPDQYSFNVVDAIVTGEGELTFVDLLRMFEQGQIVPKHVMAGRKPDLDTLPFVAREYWDYRQELACNFAPGHETPSVTMLAGRGCAFKCAYCQPAESAVFGKPYRMRSPENVIEEMCQLYDRYRFKSVTFWDDTFTFSPKWINRFCDLYERQNFGGAKIAACSRADIVCNHEDMVERLASIGVDWFVIGLETGSQRLLDLIRKGTTVEQNREAVKICRKHGIKTFATIMFGLPTETETESLATAYMIDEIRPEFTSPFWFLPIPGTDLHDYCRDNDLILSETGDRTIERTGRFVPTIKNVNYPYIRELLEERMACHA